jgi:nitrite reductase (NO-forming)
VKEQPTSRWRTTPTAGARGSADRVRLSHAQARTTLRLALAFIAAAALAAAVGSARWLPLHLFLAGGMVLAISGVSLMLTVTWSAAPAPADRWVAAQRTLVAAGAAWVAAGRQADLGDAVIGVAAVAYLGGLFLLAGMLLVTARQGVERRFDPAAAAYVSALVFGTAGVAIGAWMAVATPSATMRAAHVTINVLGLVGLVVGGTLPFFASTVGRSRMAPHASRRRLFLSLCWQATTLLIAVVALSTDATALAGIGLGGYALGVLAVLESLPRPTRRQLQWAGPRVLALWAGGLWWANAVAATAVDAAADRVVFGDRWLVVLVVAGYAQILWGSFAYLLPMLRGGGHERLAEGFASTRSWLGFAAANIAGVCAATAQPAAVTAVVIAAWVLDSAWRAARVGTTRVARPTEEPT